MTSNKSNTTVKLLIFFYGKLLRLIEYIRSINKQNTIRNQNLYEHFGILNINTVFKFSISNIRILYFC